MPVTLFCPVCNVKVDVPSRLAGKSAPCPSCGNVIDIPRQEAPAAPRLIRRLKTALPWMIAAAAAAALVVETAILLGLRSDHRTLAGTVRSLATRVDALEASSRTAPDAGMPDTDAPPPPDVPDVPPDLPPPPASEDTDELRRDVASLRDVMQSLVQRIREIEDTPATPVDMRLPPDIATDDDIEVRMIAKQEAVLPRPRFVFTGTATNAGSKSAPVVKVTIRVTAFQGVDPVTRQPVTLVSHAAQLTEHIRSLPPGTTATVWKDFAPDDPALLTRDLAWEPQFEVSTRVAQE
jgi:hypothetical protein